MWSDLLKNAVSLATSTIYWLWHLANSNFMTALAGAAAGAYGAQWIVLRRDNKRRLLEEIRTTNAAIMVAYEIVNTFCALKKQHVRRLKENFDKQKNEIEQTIEKRKRGENIPRIEFIADFETIPIPENPIGVLQSILFEKISVTGRPLSLVITLSRCLTGLAGAIRQREEVITDCRKRSPIGPDELIPLYFGFPNHEGHTNRIYPDCVSAISSYTDDCIFFCKHLMEDLVRHGQTLEKAYGKNSPRVHEPDFSKAKTENLIPEDTAYGDLLSAFKARPSTVKHFWLNKLNFLSRR